MDIIEFRQTIRQETNTDFEVRSLDQRSGMELSTQTPAWHNLKYMAAGIVFGIILVKGEIISWFRIQEMFRLESFHMYGVLGSAVMTGAISVWLIKKLKLTTLSGKPIELYSIRFSKGQIIGGLLFGAGWALTGACPGPLFAQIGAGTSVVILTLLSGIMGTWVYGLIREKLPH